MLTREVYMGVAGSISEALGSIGKALMTWRGTVRGRCLRGFFMGVLFAYALLPGKNVAEGAGRLGTAQQATSRWTRDSALKQLDAAAVDFRSLSADLERTKVTVVVNDKSTESGKILVRHDEKMRIEMTKPDPRTILRTGNSLFIYNPKINQVDEYDLKKYKSMVDQYLLLGFGTPGASLKRSYEVTLTGEETLDNHKTLVLDLVPKSEEARNQISKITMWIEESDWLPVQQKFFESGGDYFVIHYSNIVRNPKLSDNEFKPRWPKGVVKTKPRA